MKRIIFILIGIFCLSNHMKGQALYFPPVVGNSWDTLSANSLGWCTDKVDTLYDYLSSRNSKAFILLKDGKIVFEKYFGTFTADSAWYWASAGKTITSFLVGIAQQENLLSINDTTSTYLGNGWTSAPLQKEQAITIKNQLTMTSGLDDGVPDNHCTLDTCLQYLADANNRWAYHNAPYTLLDSVLESATGSPLNNYFQQKIRTNTGINGIFIKSNFDNVFYSKPRSMARFGLLMLGKGKWNGTSILTDTNYYNSMIQTSQSLNLSYGYLWWLNGKNSFMVPTSQIVIPGFMCPSAPADMYAALGKNGQVINVSPGGNLVWIRMGDAPNAGTVPFLMNDTIWQKLNAIMCIPNEVSTVASQNSSVDMYPNPANSILNIEVKSDTYAVEILDLYGRMVISKKNNEGKVRIGISDIPAGIYAVAIITKNGKQVFKVAIN